jgi:DNA invertase Pin-like site-specific DNA recombinase
MSIGIYLRVSTEEQRERPSIVTQRDFRERYGHLHDLSRNPLKHDQTHLGAIPTTDLLAVGYVRVGAVSQADPRSGLDAQVTTIRAIAEADGIEVLRVFEDCAESAHTAGRPGLLALLAAVEAGWANVIIVPDLTRLARDTGDLHSLMGSFARRGVRLVSAVERRVAEV